VTSPSEPALLRFDRVERVVHWANATLFLTLLATGLVLRGFPGTQWVGRRPLVKNIHVYSGALLPIPILLGLALRRGGRQLRQDLHRFARWTIDDRRWWSKANRARVKLGKFNPGQKLNAVFVGACLIVMPASGWMLRFPDPFSDSLRRGATAIHDWFAYALLITIIGHILFAVGDRDALRSMWRGPISAAWARLHAPRWYAELRAPQWDKDNRSDEVATRR
jgi:formate dehydrogenase subunit gamma